MNLIRSKFHSIQSIKQNKLALSYKDDKRFVNESRSDKLRQVKSSPIHADYEYTTSHGFENQNQNCSRRKTTQLDLHLRSLLRLQNNSTRPPPAQPAKQLNSTTACAACKTTQLDHRLRSLLSLQNNSTRPPPAQPAPPAQPSKQLNSTSACAACSACSTCAACRSLPPPAQPAKQLNSTSACAACSACSTCAACLRLHSLPPPAQPFAAESAFLTY
ncbi:hypothetical protein NPIL_654541, partial [Nephila pilipes]